MSPSHGAVHPLHHPVARVRLGPAPPRSRLSLGGRLAVSALANLALFMLLFQAYKIVRRGFVQRGEAIGYLNADQIIDLERRLHVFVELDIQRWALQHEWLIRALNWNYAAFMWVFYGCCVVAIGFAPGRFRCWRRVFVWSMAIALPWYALYPLAPPRFMTDHGFVDTLQQFGPRYFTAKGGLVAANQFAAMPSMHVGWTTIGALMVATALPWRRLGIAFGVYLVFSMVLTVVATGNHYLADVLGGWLVVAVAYLLASRLPVNVGPRRTAVARARVHGSPFASGR